MASSGPVVVPLDGSPYTDEALPYAAALARRLGAGLLLVRAVSVRALPGEDVQRLHDEAAARARASLLEAAARVHRWDPALSVGVALPYGPAAQGILDEAALEHSRLIVMATHGAGDRLLQPIGQLAQAVLWQAEVPVLLICSRRALMPDARSIESPGLGVLAHAPGELPAQWWPWSSPRLRVLVPLVGAPGLAAALSFVACLGAQVPLAVTLLHVAPQEPPPGLVAGSSLGRLTAAVAPTGHGAGAAVAPSRRAQPVAAELLGTGAAWLETHGVPTRIEVRQGELAVETARAAAAGADLIVLGYAPGPALPWQVPATFERIAGLTSLPLLVVPARLRASGVMPMAPEPDRATDVAHAMYPGASGKTPMPFE